MPDIHNMCLRNINISSQIHASVPNARTTVYVKLNHKHQKDTNVFVVNVQLKCLQSVAATRARIKVNVS